MAEKMTTGREAFEAWWAQAKGLRYPMRFARDSGGENYQHFLVQEIWEIWQAAAKAEREACAQVCEETTASWTQHVYNETCMDCAAAIRARGEQ